MKIEPSLKGINRLSNDWNHGGNKIALVPTMGCLHDGHLSLIRKGKESCDKVIVSIFVNPMQFGPNEDLEAYPRQFERDCELAKKEGADAVFCPNSEKMYHQGAQTMVRVQSLSLGMCGADRPGHFDGVATVVSKLFNIVHPDVALFGQKDFQQLAVINQMVKDLNFPIEIIGCPIIRETDGLAMSSRNTYLKGESRTKALSLSKALAAAKELVEQSDEELLAETVIRKTKDILRRPGVEVEYSVVVNEFSLIDENIIGENSILAVAAKIDGLVRLIDNTHLWPTK